MAVMAFGILKSKMIVCQLSFIVVSPKIIALISEVGIDPVPKLMFNSPKITKELSKKIEKEMHEREMEQIKLECIGGSNHKVEKEHVATQNAYEKSKVKNPFYGLVIEDDDDDE